MSKSEHIMFRCEPSMKTDLQLIAEERGEKVTEVIRRFLNESIQRYHGEKSMDLIASEIRKAVRDASDVYTERLAKISAKGTISSSTALYMLYELMAKQGVDVKTIYEAARKKAIANLRAGESD